MSLKEKFLAVQKLANSEHSDVDSFRRNFLLYLDQLETDSKSGCIKAEILQKQYTFAHQTLSFYTGKLLKTGIDAVVPIVPLYERFILLPNINGDLCDTACTLLTKLAVNLTRALKYSLALQALAVVAVASRDSNKRAATVVLWVKSMQNAAKDVARSTFSCIIDVLSDVNVAVPKDVALDLCFHELHACRTLHVNSSHSFVVCERLLRVAQDPWIQAFALIERTKLLLVTPTLSADSFSAEDACLEAWRVLNSTVANGHSQNSLELLAVKCDAFLVKFLCDLQRWRDKASVSFNGSDDLFRNSSTMFEAASITMGDFDIMCSSSLDLAHKIWTDHFAGLASFDGSSRYLCWMLYDIAQLLLAVLYQLHRVADALCIADWLSRLYPNCPVGPFVCAFYRECNMWVRAAAAYRHDAEVLPSTSAQQLSRLHAQVCDIVVALEANEVYQANLLAKTCREDPILLKNSVERYEFESVLLIAESRLASHGLLDLPACVHLYRSYMKLSALWMKKDCFATLELESCHLHVLETLTVLRDLGASCQEVGLVFAADSYWTEGKQLANRICSLKWVLEFSIRLLQLHIICERSEAVEGCLSALETVCMESMKSKKARMRANPDHITESLSRLHISGDTCTDANATFASRLFVLVEHLSSRDEDYFPLVLLLVNAGLHSATTSFNVNADHCKKLSERGRDVCRKLRIADENLGNSSSINACYICEHLYACANVAVCQRDWKHLKAICAKAACVWQQKPFYEATLLYLKEVANLLETIEKANLSFKDALSVDLRELVTVRRSGRGTSARKMDSTLRRALLDCRSCLEGHFTKFCKQRFCPFHREVCELLAVLHRSSDVWKAAFYLSEAGGVCARSASIFALARHEGSSCNFSVPSFAHVDAFREHVVKLPSNWAVVLYHVMSSAFENIVLIGRIEAGDEPLVVLADCFIEKEAFLSEMLSIQRENTDTSMLKVSDEFWSARRQLDERLQAFIEQFEKKLGLFVLCLLGRSSRCTEGKHSKLCAALGISNLISRLLVETWTAKYDAAERKAFLEALLPVYDRKELLIAKLDELRDGSELSAEPRGPVLLCVDHEFRQIPWENLTGLANQSICRLLSFHFVVDALAKRKDTLVNPSRTFYVVDPSSEFKKTAERIGSWFKRQRTWQGYVGSAPSTEEINSALASKDLYIYCGHGAGSRYLERKKLRPVACRAAALLMGCSSVEQRRIGSVFEPYNPNQYFVRLLQFGSPGVVGCLWLVTDRDIDLFTEALLCIWTRIQAPSPISTSKGAGRRDHVDDVPPEGNANDLLRAIAAARKACKLRYLTGCAPVVYGLPLQVTDT